MDPAIAAACDAGTLEDLPLDPLAGAADIIQSI
jgi:hypothetical protein